MNPQNTSQKNMIPLVDFGALQTRYESLPLAGRAKAILADVEPALAAANDILTKLAAHPESKKRLGDLRKNSLLIGKMRPSEAKNMLQDTACDFIDGTRHKLAAWRKTIERISQGESIMSANGKEFIPGHAPLALAIIGNACVSNYLSIVQLLLADIGKTDASFASMAAEVRRCSTVISDCEVASGITQAVH